MRVWSALIVAIALAQGACVDRGGCVTGGPSPMQAAPAVRSRGARPGAARVSRVTSGRQGAQHDCAPVLRLSGGDDSFESSSSSSSWEKFPPLHPPAPAAVAPEAQASGGRQATACEAAGGVGAERGRERGREGTSVDWESDTTPEDVSGAGAGEGAAVPGSASDDAEPRLYLNPAADPGDLEIDVGTGSRSPWPAPKGICIYIYIYVHTHAHTHTHKHTHTCINE
jgi:hypothetical protein